MYCSRTYGPRIGNTQAGLDQVFVITSEYVYEAEAEGMIHWVGHFVPYAPVRNLINYSYTHNPHMYTYVLYTKWVC